MSDQTTARQQTSSLSSSPAVEEATTTATTTTTATKVTATEAALLDVVNEKELKCPSGHKDLEKSEMPTKSYLQSNSEEPKYSKAQQANQITLKQIRNAKLKFLQSVPMTAQSNENVNVEDLESNENEHLLGGQDQQQQSSSATVVAIAGQHHGNHCENATDGRNCSGKNLRGEKASILNQNPVNPLGTQSSNAATAVTDIDSKVHSKLELQNIPKEMLQSHSNDNNNSNNSNKEQNGSTIILTPTSLTTSGATLPPAGGQSGYNIGGGGGGNGSHTLDYGSKDVDYKGPRFWQYLVRNYPVSSQPLAILIIFLTLWTWGYILMPDYAIPSTVIMRIAFLFVGAQTAGILVTFIHLPDMLGMLFFGVLYCNVGLANFEGYAKFEGFLREMALINIMLLAGLGLDANAFKKLWLMIMRLTLIPTIAEVSVIAILAYLLLNMPWLWGILLGLVITAVSPNVVVTVMLKLKEDRLGLNSGIHTLIYAMTTCNDVVAIFVFGVINGVIFSTGGSLTEQIIQGPIGIGIGIVYGYLYGLMLQFIPSRNSTYANGLRFVLIILGGAISVMGSKFIKYPSAGALGCVTVAFIAGMGWKKQYEKMSPQQKQIYENSCVSKRLDLLWKFLKPVSFALIGKEINFAVLDGKVVGYGALLVLLGSLFRLAFAYISTYGGNLTKKERAYITISGFPKATVQAALGPIALDMAREINADDNTVSLARNVLIISVLAIIFTAPLGAILMLRLAPKWLKYSPPVQSTNDIADENDDIAGGYVNDIVNPNEDNSQRVVPI